MGTPAEHSVSEVCRRESDPGVEGEGWGSDTQAEPCNTPIPLPAANKKKKRKKK
ncbi:hypothetical protein R3I94_019639 [Phoxinus phoxinus]